MATTKPISNQNYIGPIPSNLIIPLEIGNIIIAEKDSNLIIMDQQDQIYGKALDGLAIVIYKNGNKYEGVLENGLLHGKGTFYWMNEGVKYTGQFWYNQISGKGRFEWSDGSWYEGDVKLGLRNGQGTFWTPISSGGEVQFTGDWKDGFRDGKGVLKFKSGSIYEGEFKKGAKHGWGKMTYPSGNYYEGQWAFDKKEGQGTMYWLKTNEKYYGNWQDNKQNGFGVHIWLEPKSEGKFLRNRYEGLWKNGLRHGYGTFYYSNGSKYEGEWVNNLKEGFAIFTHDDGRISKSWFKSDKLIQAEQTQPPITKIPDGDFSVDIPRETSFVGSQSGLVQHSTKRGTKDVSQNQNNPTTQNNPTSQNNQNTQNNPNNQTNPNTQAKPSINLKKTGKTSFTNTRGDGLNTTKKDETETNPYENLICINDLLLSEDDPRSIIIDVQNVLLRYHTEMKDWYQIYVEKQHHDSEESFALTNKSFWKLLKDCNVLSPKITIANFNRLFLQGSKNNFELKTNIEALKIRIEKEKKEYLAEQSAKGNEKDMILNELLKNEKVEEKKEEVQEDINIINYINAKIDIHDESRCILFRHFADGLVRAAFLKYGGGKDLPKGLDKLLGHKIKPGIENKKKLKSSQLQYEQILQKIKPMSERYKATLQEWFNKFPAKSQTFLFNNYDFTMTVRGMIDLFTKARLIEHKDDKECFIRVVERYFDPEETYNMNAIFKERERGIVNNNPNRDAKFAQLLQSEFIFLEFFDTFIIYAFKKDGLQVKEAEVHNRYKKYLQALQELANQEKSQDPGSSQVLNWPISQKEEMFKNLKFEKKKRERELAIIRQKKLEKENEERELKAMRKEDFNINLIVNTVDEKEEEEKPESEGEEVSFDNDF